MEQEKKVKKLSSYKSGRIWLNVLETKDGIELFTINRSFKTSEGWRSSPFFQLEAGDVEAIKNVLGQYDQFGSTDNEMY
ncbi:hypothetical protein ACFL6B_04580 [Thermodesulfobacteriota bacterium]